MSHLTEAIPMNAKSEFPEAFQDFIRKWGAPEELISDNAKEQISLKVQDILNMYNIPTHHKSEAYQQNQNTAERHIQDIKRSVEAVVDRTNMPAVLWLLCLLFIVGLFNHVANESIGNLSPITKATNQPVDVSKYLCFCWLEPVYYYQPDSSFPFIGHENSGWYVGPADDVGDILTHQILDANSFKVIA